MSEIKLFNKWSFDGIIVLDEGLKNYINLEPIIIPRTDGYYHNTPFYKNKINIVERIMNRLQVCGHKNKKHKFSSGHNTGKARNQTKMIEDVLTKIEILLKENPISILVKAIENAAPREEVITIERAGARYIQAVDIGPLRRVDLVIRYLCQGATQKAQRNKKSVVDCLVEEIVECYNLGNNSNALNKRIEIEKMAMSAK